MGVVAGDRELANPGGQYRLKQAVAFLAALVGRLLAVKAPGAHLRWSGRTLRLADGACVGKPGSKGTDWRVHGVFDLGSGGFSHPELTDKHWAVLPVKGYNFINVKNSVFELDHATCAVERLSKPVPPIWIGVNASAIA